MQSLWASFPFRERILLHRPFEVFALQQQNVRFEAAALLISTRIFFESRGVSFPGKLWRDRADLELISNQQ